MKKETKQKKMRILKQGSNKNKVNRLKVFIIALIMIVLFFYALRAIVLLIKNPTNTVIVTQGEISKEENQVGYIIRNETVVKGENYKNGMEQIVSEGQKVAKNESIFRYYSNNEQEIIKELAELDKQIEENVESQNEQLTSSDIKLLEAQIDKQLVELNKLNSVQSIQETKKTINNYIMKKALIVGELSPKGSKLKELITKRNETEKKLTSGAEYINAPVSGILSYKIDGLEETLTGNDFSKYNKSFLEGLNLKTGKIVPTSIEQGKIVDNTKCYIAFTSKSEESLKAEIGDKIKILLPSTREVSAKVEYIIKENESENTIVLSFSEGIEELTNYRKISFDIIWWSSKGYKVPNSSIITQNNLNYLIRSRAGYLEKVLVKVVKKTNNYSIITSYKSSEIKELNVDKKAKTTVLLYDEILLNPTENQIKSTE